MLNQIGCSKTNPELDIDQFCAVLTGHRMDGSAFLQLRDARGLLTESVSGPATQILDIPAEAVFLDWQGTLQRVN